MRYKVGDKVRVRKDLKLNKEYGGWFFNDDMNRFSGKEVTIETVNSHNYCIEEDTFYWTDEMFEPVTNWDKVKEEIDIKDVSKIGNPFCQAVHRVRDEENCIGMRCDECAKWLKQPYKEPSILDEAEKKYLSAVIRPWRDKVEWVSKRMHASVSDYEFIKISVKNDYGILLPNFDKGTMYKGMELNKQYSLEDLEI